MDEKKRSWVVAVLWKAAGEGALLQLIYYRRTVGAGHARPLAFPQKRICP